jgi:hypothetical protein
MIFQSYDPKDHENNARLIVSCISKHLSNYTGTFSNIFVNNSRRDDFVVRWLALAFGWPVLAIVGPRWPAWAVISHHWLSLCVIVVDKPLIHIIVSKRLNKIF